MPAVESPPKFQLQDSTGLSVSTGGTLSTLEVARLLESAGMVEASPYEDGNILSSPLCNSMSFPSCAFSRTGEAYCCERGACPVTPGILEISDERPSKETPLRLAAMLPFSSSSTVIDASDYGAF